MAVESIGSAIKSAPDISKLQAMQQPVVVVTKGRKGAGRAIYSGIKASVNDILAMMQHSLVTNYGAGIYKFEVTDAGGDGSGGSKDVWTAQLGPDTVFEFQQQSVLAADNGAGQNNELSEDFSMPVAPASSNANAQNSNANGNGGVNGHAPNNGSQHSIGLSPSVLQRPVAQPSMAPPSNIPEGSVMVAPGWWYNENLAILSNRNGELHTWRPGMPLPGATITPNMPPMPAWGSIPVAGNNAEDERFKVLEKQLAEEREANRERARRDEIMAMRVTMEKAAEQQLAFLKQAIETQNNTLAKALESLKVPVGETSTERALREALAKAEAQREADRQAQQFQQALAALEAKLAEATHKQPDQTLPIFMQLLAQQQQSASAMIQAVQAAAQSGTEAARENSRLMLERLGPSQLTPERMVELLRIAKDRGPDGEVNKHMMGMVKDILGMGQDMLRTQADALGAGQPSTPAWVGIAQQLADKAGSVAQAIAVSKAQDSARAERQERHERDRREQARQDRIANAHLQVRAVAAVPQVAAAPAIAPAPRQAAPAAPAQRTAATIRDDLAAQMFAPVTSGPQAERDALAAQIGLVPAAAMAESAPAPKGKRGRKPKAQPAAVQPAPTAYVMPASVDESVNGDAEGDLDDEDDGEESGDLLQNGDVVDDVAVNMGSVNATTLANESAEVVRNHVSRLSDLEFFGPMLQPHIVNLREQVASGVLSQPEEITNYIGQAITMLQQLGTMPPAVELIYNGHAAIAVQRLLPDAPGKLVSAVIAQVIDAVAINEEE